MREDGYYWVKDDENSQWSIGQWYSDVWWFMFNPNHYDDSDLAKIGERIKEPEGE